MNTQLPAMSAVELDARSPIPAYLKASAAVCPFIEPAAKAGCLFACEIAPDIGSVADIHPRLFEQLVPRVEAFRTARRVVPDKQRRLLICHTVVIHTPPHLDAEVVRQLAWPNWLAVLLKQLYTPTEVVFGFVRKGVVEKSMFGRSVPVSPFHAVIIRSRVVGSDQRFFTGNQPMLDAMMSAEDDGRDVLAAVGHAPDPIDPQSLRDAGYFDRARQWGQKLLAVKG